MSGAAAAAAFACAIALTGCRAGPNERDAAAPFPARVDLLGEVDLALEAGSTEEALALLAMAIEQNPTLTVAHMRMGEVYESTGDYESAEASYRRAADLAPRDFDAQYKHGFALHALKRLAEAVRAYLRALTIRPNDFEANLNLSIAYLELNEAALAEPFAAEAAAQRPSDGAARANLGNVLSELGRDRRAIIEYEAAAELMELGPELLLNLSQSLARLDRFAEMEHTLRRAIELGESAAAWERLGYAQFKQRSFAEAAASFERSIELDAGHYPALNGLAVCLLNRWHASDGADEASRARAVRLLRRSLQVRPDQTRIVSLVDRYSR